MSNQGLKGFLEGLQKQMEQQVKHRNNLLRNMQNSGGRSGGGGPSSEGPSGGPPNFKGLAGGGAGLALLIGGGVVISQSLFNVDGGHRAVKYSRLTGVKPDIYNEGTHFMIPWFERSIDYDVRAKPRSIASLTGTKDLQMVNITCRVLSRPSVDSLPNIYRELGVDYDERVLPSIVNGEWWLW